MILHQLGDIFGVEFKAIAAEEAIVKNDETMQKLAKLEKITNSNLDYIERALSILQDFGFQ